MENVTAAVGGREAVASGVVHACDEEIVLRLRNLILYLFSIHQKIKK